MRVILAKLAASDARFDFTLNPRNPKPKCIESEGSSLARVRMLRQALFESPADIAKPGPALPASSGEAPDELEKLRRENAELRSLNEKLAKELNEALQAVVSSETPEDKKAPEEEVTDEALRKRLYRMCGQKDAKG